MELENHVIHDLLCISNSHHNQSSARFFKKANIMHLLLIVSFLIDFMMWNLEMSVKIHAKRLEGLRKCCN